MNGAQFTILLQAVGAGQVGAEFGKVQAVLTRLNSVLGAFGVSVSAGLMAKMVKDAIDYADSLGKVAQKAGVAVRELSQLAVAAKMSEVSTDQLAKASKGLAQSVSDASRGAGEAARAWADLGVSFTNSSGGLKNFAELLPELADVFMEMPDGIRKTELATKLFGKAGQDMIPLLNQGSAKLRETMEEAKRFGVVVGPQFAANAEAFNDNLTRIGFAFKGLFLQLAERVLPALVDFTDWIVDFLKNSPALTFALEQMTTVFKTLAAVVAEIAFTFDALGSFLGTFAGTLSATGNPFQAWSAAADQFEEKLKTLQRRMAAIGAIGEPSDDSGGGGGGSPAIAKSPRELLDEQRRRLDTMIDAVRLSRQQTERDSSLSPAERQRELNDALQQEIGYIKEKIRLSEQAHFSDVLDDDQFNAMNVRDRRQLFGAHSSLSDNSLMRALNDLMTRWGTVSQQIADGFVNVIGSAVDAVSNGIQGLIMGTMTWGQALRNIGTTIMGSVVKAIADMFAKWIVGRLAVKAVEIAAGKAEALAKLPGALMTSISSYGVAALVGAAALAGVMAAAGAFEEGGYTGAGNRSQVAGVVHRGEYVFSAPAVDRIGLANLEALHGGAPAAASTAPVINQRFAVLTDESQLPNWARQETGEAWVVDVMRRNMHKL